MAKIGFDNHKYIETQSAHIRERIGQFGGKLYLEFGGKLFDDFHASRVLPGFEPDSKIRMLQQLRDDVEIVVTICAGDIEKNKVRGDLGIPYEEDVLRLIDIFQGMDLYVGSVVITRYSGQPAADAFLKRLNALGVKAYLHYPIAGYPHKVDLIVSDQGYGRNDYIETTRPLVVVTAPGPGSGKMATCLSQLYHEHKRGRQAGYAKFETFPIWNLPLKHPVNLAYEAATADLNDINMIDPFHLEAYGVTTVNYNRDVEVFPVLRTIFESILGECPYKSPTDMGVNMAGSCIVDDEVCREASHMEILRRYYAALTGRLRGTVAEEIVYKLALLRSDAGHFPRRVRGADEGGGHRRAGGGAGPAGRQGHYRQDQRAAGGVRRAAAQRAEGPGRYRPGSGSDFQPGVGAHLPPENRESGQQEPPAPQRRGADRPVRERADQPHRRPGPAAAGEAEGVRRALHRRAQRGGRKAVPAVGDARQLRGQV